MDPSVLLPKMLGAAVLVPLVSFFVILIGGGKWMGKGGRSAAYVAVFAIGFSALLSFGSLGIWLRHHFPSVDHGSSHAAEHTDHADATRPARVVRGQDPASATTESADAHAKHDSKDGPHDHAHEKHDHAAHSHEAHAPGHDGHAHDGHAHDGHAAGSHEAHGHGAVPPAYSGDFRVPLVGVPWVLGQFGDLRLSISYYIDALTIGMFCMVTFIATLIHIYAMGYMHDEQHDITDHEVIVSSGAHLHRPGRYHRFFQYLSLFCFSMLGLVVAGNIAMVFVFWELVGACSYFLIGFYVERKSASTAANKAFITNRVGDFGMIIGLMALWTSLGTFSFGDTQDASGNVQAGLFSQVRSSVNEHRLVTPDGMVLLSARDEVAAVLRELGPGASPAEQQAAIETRIDDWRDGRNPEGRHYGYWLLIVAGIGIFTGCVGKSAQFPLHVWLPDAMEGPTPVSALVHSATMVAAGVYLVGRFYPVFAPEVLLVIAVVGCITLFMAASIAITATDIKRVLAYSTVSQLGYMMLALGVGGWLAGMMHLVTHAFFKSLLFMCSGSVIHAVHTNDMRNMGGLLKKMPVTAITMLIGCLAIAGAGLPFIIGWMGGSELAGLGFSGFYSKDAILEQAFSFWKINPSAWSGAFFLAAAGGAAMTAFYMFRMWYLTFAGAPRDQERYDHAHESPPLMFVPLIVLSIMAVTVAWSPLQGLVGGLVASIGFLIFKLMRGRRAETSTHVSHGAHATGAHPLPETQLDAAHTSIMGQVATSHATQTPALHVHADDHGHSGAHTHDAPHHDDHAQGHGHDDHGHDGHGHAHETTHLGWLPLADVPLAASVLVFAISLLTFAFARDLTLGNLLESARPTGTLATTSGVLLNRWVWPNEHDSHHPSIVVQVTLMAIGTAFVGFMLATVMYGLRRLSAEEVRRQFQPIYRFLVNKWWFDELYGALFIRPTHVVSRFISSIDRLWIDRLVDGLAKGTRWFSVLWERIADRTIVDGFVNLFAGWTYSLGVSLRVVQTGQLRQYVMFIVIGAVAIFVLISLWNSSLAG